MFLYEQELSRKLEEKCHELLHTLEEKKDSLLRELSGVDKITLTKLRTIMADYYNAQDTLSRYVQIYDVSLSVAQEEFVKKLSEIRGDFETQVLSYVNTYPVEDCVREVVERIASESGFQQLYKAFEDLELAVFDVSKTVSINKFNPNTVDSVDISGQVWYVSEKIPCSVGDVLYFNYQKDDGTLEHTSGGVTPLNESGFMMNQGYRSYTVTETDLCASGDGVHIVVKYGMPYYNALPSFMVTINEEPTEFSAWIPDETVKRNRMDAISTTLQKQAEEIQSIIDQLAELGGGNGEVPNLDGIEERVSNIEGAIFEEIENVSINKFNPETVERSSVGGLPVYVTELIPCSVGDTVYFRRLVDGELTDLSLGVYLVDESGTSVLLGLANYAKYVVAEHASISNLVGVKIAVQEARVPYEGRESIIVTLNEKPTKFSAWTPTTTQKVSKDSLCDQKVLIIGDSISTDYYGEYEKWVTKLIKSGFFNAGKVTNDSIHATGFVARFNDQPNDFITRIEAITNKESYDLVIIFGGINDYLHNIPLGESGGDKTTHFKPAVDYFFEYLTNNFTQAKIVVLSPLRTFQTTQNTEGVLQTVYADYIKTVAKSYCLPILNLTEESGFYPWVANFRHRWTFTEWAGGDGVTGDGVHPNEEWEEKRLAPMIKAFLKRLF